METFNLPHFRHKNPGKVVLCKVEIVDDDLGMCLNGAVYRNRDIDNDRMHCEH